MDLTLWSEGLYSDSDLGLESCTAEHLYTSQPDTSSISLFGNSSGCTDSGSCLKQMDLCTSRDSKTASLSKRGRHTPSPTYSGQCNWTESSGHLAKRARVENIIKGMTNSPATDKITTASWHEGAKSLKDTWGRGEAVTESHRSHDDRTGTQDQSVNRHSGQLRMLSAGRVEEETHFSKAECPHNSISGKHTSSHSDSECRQQGWKKVKLMNYLQSKPEKFQLIADVLKYELSKAASKTVDTIFKSWPLLHTSPPTEDGAETEDAPLDLQLQSSIWKENKSNGSSWEGNRKLVPDIQTEALSLVVHKCVPTPLVPVVLHATSTAKPCSGSSLHLGHQAKFSETKMSESHQNTTGFLGRHPEAGPTKMETFDSTWNSLKVRSKVNSRSLRGPKSCQHVSLVPSSTDSRRHPKVKMETQTNMYLLNEGLTTNHLKKAKLMFFYTRYPSSLVLKTCFSDVQFTRCVTSQLIKWFSNFREFYYIQMEKYARHAVMEGVSDMRVLTVGRESELFRALNLHYNKANDFQVPDRFLEVAEITLREFYFSISMQRDRDPSWKKAIYKVICKLDGNVPAEFQGHTG